MWLGCNGTTSSEVHVAPRPTAPAPAPLIVTPAEEAERLTNEQADEIFPHVAADGALTLFQAERYEGIGPDRKLTSQRVVALTRKPSGLERQELTEPVRAASRPVLLPDRSGFLYVTNATGPLSVVRAASLAVDAPVTMVLSGDRAPEPSELDVSSDGSKIALSMRSLQGGRGVAVASVDGKTLTPIGEGRAPRFSPDGKEIVFVRTEGGFNHLFLIGSDGQGQPKQITRGPFDCDTPAFSPDGARIVFASNRGYQERARSRNVELQLFVITRDGSSLTQITQGNTRSATPFWSADGHLYFSSDRAGSLDLYRVKAPQTGAR